MSKETYTNEQRPRNETCTHKKRPTHIKETYTYQKRPVHMKRDLEERPYPQAQELFVPHMHQKRTIHMKRDLEKRPSLGI